MGSNSEVREIIFFDGVCNLCNSSVNFVIDRDPISRFNFAALQSDFAQEVLAPFNLSPENLDGIIFLNNDRVYVKSRAALEVSRRMRGAWPLMYVFIIVPGFIRNLVYDFIARNRYKWYGKQETCRIPTPDLKSRFLDS